MEYTLTTVEPGAEYSQETPTGLPLGYSESEEYGLQDQEDEHDEAQYNKHSGTQDHSTFFLCSLSLQKSINHQQNNKHSTVAYGFYTNSIT